MTLEAFEKNLPLHLRQWAREFYGVGIIYCLCPYLLAAVCDRESRGGLALKPIGASGTGDMGHGRGLLQVDDRFHLGFVCAADSGGHHLWKKPAFNVLYGAALLRANIDTLGDVHLALSAYNAGVTRVRESAGKVMPSGDKEADLARRRAAADERTTGDNYAADTIRRRAQWAPPEAPLTT